MNAKSLAKKAGFNVYEHIWIANEYDIKRFAELVRQDEREACAKLCDAVDAAHEGDYVLAKWCATAIRGRTE
jgi:hypothetical protein